MGRLSGLFLVVGSEITAYGLIPTILIASLLKGQVLPGLPFQSEALETVLAQAYLWIYPLELLAPFLILPLAIPPLTLIALLLSVILLIRRHESAPRLLSGTLAVSGALEVLALSNVLFTTYLGVILNLDASYFQFGRDFFLFLFRLALAWLVPFFTYRYLSRHLAAAAASAHSLM